MSHFLFCLEQRGKAVRRPVVAVSSGQLQHTRMSSWPEAQYVHGLARVLISSCAALLAPRMSTLASINAQEERAIRAGA